MGERAMSMGARAGAAASLGVTILVLGASLAHAKASLIVQVRSDMAPGTEFVSVESLVVSETKPVFATRVFTASPADDFAAGIRVAEVTSLPSGETFLQVCLLDAGDARIECRAARLILDDNIVRVVTILMVRPPCPYNPPFRWLGWTSEEFPVFECPVDTAVTGLLCEAMFCDNLRLRCRPVAGVHLGAERWTPFFSEEDAGLMGCASDEVMTGLECNGDFCDNISLRCSHLPGTIGECHTSPAISEPDEFSVGRGFFRRIECLGSNCDDKIIEVCRRQDRPMALRGCVLNCASVSGFSGELELDGAALEIAACSSPEMNKHQRWELRDDGQLVNSALDRCLLPGGEQQGPHLGSCLAGDAPRWAIDAQGRIRGLPDRKLCLGVGVEGEPSEPPIFGTPMRLEPCLEPQQQDEGPSVGQSWFIPGECGDVDDDGRVGSSDVGTYRKHLTDPNGNPLSPTALETCSVIGGPTDCDLRDVVVLRRLVNVESLPPGIDPVCPAARGE